MFVKNSLYICFALLFLQSNCSQNSLVPSEDPFMHFIISAGVGTLATYCAPSKYLTINPNKLAMGGLGLYTAAGTYEIVKRSYPDFIKNMGIKLGLSIAKQKSLNKLAPVVMGLGFGIAFGGAFLSMYYKDNLWNEDIECGCNRNHLQIDDPLNHASMHGNIKIVKKLLKEELLKEVPNIDIINHLDHTPLISACNSGHLKIAELLIAAGASVDHVGDSDTTALMYASINGHTQIVDLLLKNNAAVNHVRPRRETALTWACSEGHLETAQLLIAAGADLNHVNDRGMTALMLASYYGYTEIVQLLLAAGANIHYECPSGERALYIAYNNGQMGVFNLLLEHENQIINTIHN